MYTVILLWHVSGCGPLSLNQINLCTAQLAQKVTRVLTMERYYIQIL